MRLLTVLMILLLRAQQGARVHQFRPFTLSPCTLTRVLPPHLCSSIPNIVIRYEVENLGRDRHRTSPRQITDQLRAYFLNPGNRLIS
jgi:hypothetical protein